MLILFFYTLILIVLLTLLNSLSYDSFSTSVASASGTTICPKHNPDLIYLTKNTGFKCNGTGNLVTIPNDIKEILDNSPLYNFDSKCIYCENNNIYVSGHINDLFVYQKNIPGTSTVIQDHHLYNTFITCLCIIYIFFIICIIIYSLKSLAK